MNDTQCKIQMLDLYFSKYSFNNARGKVDSEYTTSFKIEYAINSGYNTKVKVTIDTTIANSTETIKLDLQTIGIFQIDKNDIDEATYDQLIKANTVAIIFPFIRSQVSLLTTQPGMMPVIIPPININALISEQNYKSNIDMQ